MKKLFLLAAALSAFVLASCGNSAGGGSGGGSRKVSPGWYCFADSSQSGSESYYYFDENGNILEAGTGSTKFTGASLSTMQANVNYFTLKQSADATPNVTLTLCGKPSWGTRDNPPPEIKSLALSPSPVSLKVGEKQTITASVSPSSLQNSVTLEWTNSDDSVADWVQSADGLSVTVTGKSTGTATVGCSYNGHSGKCKVTVEEIDPETEYLNSHWWGESGTWVEFYKAYKWDNGGRDSIYIHYDANGTEPRGGVDSFELSAAQLAAAIPQYSNMSEAIAYWNENCPNKNDDKLNGLNPTMEIPRKNNNYYEFYTYIWWGK